MLTALALCLALQLPHQGPPPNEPARVRADRLNRLADHLEKRVAARNFSQATWGNTDDPMCPEYLGCSGGHATTLFRTEGLRYGREARGYRTVVYGGMEGVDACQHFFGLDFSTALWLFTAPCPIAGLDDDPLAAARRFRAVAAGERGP